MLVSESVIHSHRRSPIMSCHVMYYKTLHTTHNKAGVAEL